MDCFSQVEQPLGSRYVELTNILNYVIMFKYIGLQHCIEFFHYVIGASGEATGGGGFEPPLASRTTPGIRTKPQRNFFGRG
jgi:hypothetical protein